MDRLVQWKRWRIAVGVFLFFVNDLGIVSAQDIAATFTRINSLRAQLTPLMALKTGAEVAEATAQREKGELIEADRVLKAAEKRQREDEPRQKMTFQEHEAALVKKWEWFNPAFEKYRASGCPMGGEFSKSEIARCAADHERLFAAKPQLFADFEGLKNEVIALEKDKQALIDQRNKLTQATLANATAQRKAEADLADAKEKIQKLTAELQSAIALCGGLASNEEMKLKCGNVQFDGATPGLGKFHYQGIGTPKMR